MAIDEAELEPLEFAEKMHTQQEITTTGEANMFLQCLFRSIQLNCIEDANYILLIAATGDVSSNQKTQFQEPICHT